MSATEFAMVEELASLIKDNLSSKHIVLSVEETLVDFLKNDTSKPDGILELEPMSPYHRLLLHRLADIYGFSHESVGEGDCRRLVLERCPESSIPSVLVSDILWQYDQDVSPVASSQLFRRNEVLPDCRMETTTFSPTITLEEREAAYMAARERIFSMNDGEAKETSTPKQRNVPVVARRMIAHALGQKIFSAPQNQLPATCECGEDSVQVGKTKVEKNVEADVLDATILSRKQSSTRKKMSRKPQSENVVGDVVNMEKKAADIVLSSGKAGQTEVSKVEVGRDSYKVEHMGAAKRMFVHALGLPKDGNSLLAKHSDASSQVGLKS